MQLARNGIETRNIHVDGKRPDRYDQSQDNAASIEGGKYHPQRVAQERKGKNVLF